MANKRKEVDAKMYSGRFAIRLRILREKAGFAAEDIAQLTGIPKKTIYNWEAGISQPPVDALPILAKAYGVRIRTLFPDE